MQYRLWGRFMWRIVCDNMLYVNIKIKIKIHAIIMLLKLKETILKRLISCISKKFNIIDSNFIVIYNYIIYNLINYSFT